ncbi:MAG: prolipoprotein diacylglyceryl transferase [Candidatus Omnitrophota bacterium]|nr:prolipoprotein diacylglyceryl transferase [Candidatus Omnitrophota bacterium]
MFPSWGPISSMYQLMTTVAFAAGASYYVVWALSEIPSIRKRDLLLVLIGATFASKFGGALIPYLYRTRVEHWHGPYLWAGFHFHSAFLSAFFYGVAAAALLRWPVKKCMDHYAIAAMIASPIARIGCFLRGCCYGKPSNLPWAVTFPEQPGVRVHPTQLYTVGLELLILWILLRLIKRQRYDGQTLWTAIWLYSLYRAWIEMIRTNPVFLWGMTAVQLTSLVTLLLSTFVLLYHRDRRPAKEL